MDNDPNIFIGFEYNYDEAEDMYVLHLHLSDFQAIYEKPKDKYKILKQLKYDIISMIIHELKEETKRQRYLDKVESARRRGAH